jgi:hypothetical protein
MPATAAGLAYAMRASAAMPHPDHNRPVPVLAVEFLEPALGDQLVGQSPFRLGRHRLIAHAGRVVRGDVCPHLELGPDRPGHLGELGDQKQLRPAHGSGPPPSADGVLALAT